eukprot:g7649.t1
MHRIENAVVQSQKWGTRRLPDGSLASEMPAPKEVGAPEHRGKVDYEYLQCAVNGKMPGYTGFMPTKYAQSQYGQPAADVHQRSGNLVMTKPIREDSAAYVPKKLKAKPEDYFNVPPQWTHSYSSKAGLVFTEEEQPAKRKILKNYSVSVVPGYSGYFPAKKAENIMGGGITYCAEGCRDVFARDRDGEPQMRGRPHLYKEMREYYERQAEERLGDDVWIDPNFLRKPYCHQGYRNDSRISVTGKSFSTKYGHRTELAEFGHLYNH